MAAAAFWKAFLQVRPHCFKEMKNLKVTKCYVPQFKDRIRLFRYASKYSHLSPLSIIDKNFVKFLSKSMGCLYDMYNEQFLHSRHVIRL